MSELIRQDHNVASGEITEHKITKAEADQLAADKIADQLRSEAEAAKATEKAALLARLGITDDEAKLLLS
jgi:regulator of protease activity HflC (stomatin/prohibitin superfamily)